MKSLSFRLLAGLLFASAAVAADAMQLRNAVFQEVEVTNAAGQKVKQMVPAKTVTPGDEVIYVITYQNAGAQPATNVVIKDPVPSSLEFKPGSAGAGAEVSIDGGNTWGALAQLRIKGTDGKSRAAQAADVTHVRWVIGAAVAPGAEGTVSYRARLK